MDSNTNPFYEILEFAHKEAMKSVHTMLPGVIESFDSDTQLAKIKVAQGQELITGEVIPYPPLINTPIQFQEWGDYVITMPVRKGDECAVHFSERSLDLYLEAGATEQAPRDTRFFNLSDGFAVPGLRSKPNAIQSFNTDALEIRDKDGLVFISLNKTGDIQITNGILDFQIKKGTVSISNGAAELVDIISQALQLLSTDGVIVAGVKLPLVNSAAYGLLKVLLDTLKG